MHGPDPVYRRVVNLVVDRKLPVLQTLNQMRFPEGSGAVQESGVQAGRQREQLAVASRGGQGAVAHMIVHVHLCVFFPEQTGTARDRIFRERAPECGRGAQHLAQVLEKAPLVCALWQSEEIDAADMHGGFALFQQQEAGAG